MTEVRLSYISSEVLAEGSEIDVRLSFVSSSPLTGGNVALRLSFIGAEAATGGNIRLRVSDIAGTPLTGGNIDVRIADIFTQVLTGVGQESEVTAIFPTLDGIVWPVVKRPQFSTQVAEHTSGHEVRVAFWEYPRYEFELSFEWLSQKNGRTDYETLIGFFLQRKGSFEAFLFDDIKDNTATLVELPQVGGTGLQYYLVRNLGGFVEPVGQLKTGTLQVFVDGVLVPDTEYVINMPNKITFDSEPTGVVTATFSYYFVCRFTQDAQDYQEFMSNLWELGTCTFKSLVQP